MGQGPLADLKVLEFAGIGPGPFCGMLLSDLGADVVRIDRKGSGRGSPTDVTGRGRRSVAMDLKSPAAVEACLKLMETADAVFEGFRPGVMERLGLGPDVALARNHRLVYGRMTGWGQTGPLARAAGHDMNYIALSGALHSIGRRGERPVPPLNLVGDFGGGGLMLAYGIVCALLEVKGSGKGQVIDCSMVEGSAALMAMFYDMRAQGTFNDTRGTNLLDTGAPFYEVYETKDGRFVALGPIEPHFNALFMQKLELDPGTFGSQFDVARWPEQKDAVAAVIRRKTRDEWCALLEGTDVCFAPVLSLGEAPVHPHNVERGSFLTVGGVTQPAPTPRFSRTPASPPEPVKPVSTDTRAVLTECGYTNAEIDALCAKGVAEAS